MVSDRSARGRRRRATDPPLEVEPAEAAAQMEEATQRLRERAWMINATTITPGSAMTPAMDPMTPAMDPMTPAMDGVSLD